MDTKSERLDEHRLKERLSDEGIGVEFNFFAVCRTRYNA